MCAYFFHFEFVSFKMWVRVVAVLTILLYTVGAEQRLVTRNLRNIQPLNQRNLNDERIDLKFKFCAPTMRIILHDQPRYSNNVNGIVFDINAYGLTVSERTSRGTTKQLRRAPMPRWSCNKQIKLTVSWSMSTLMLTQDCDKSYLLNMRHNTAWRVKGVGVASDKVMSWNYGEGICPKKGNSNTGHRPGESGNKATTVHELITNNKEDIKALNSLNPMEKETVDFQLKRCHNKIQIFLHKGKEYSYKWGSSVKFVIDEYSISAVLKTFFDEKSLKEKSIAQWPCNKSVKLTVSWRNSRLTVTKDCGAVTLLDIPQKLDWKVEGVSVSSIKSLQWRFGEGFCLKKENPSSKPPAGNKVSCPRGSVLLGTSCIKICSSNAHCKPNNVCRGGKCIAAPCQSAGSSSNACHDHTGIDRENNHKPISGNKTNQNSGNINNNSKINDNENHNIKPNNNHVPKPPPSDKDAKGDNSQTNSSEGNGTTDMTATSSPSLNVATTNTTGSSTSNQTDTGGGPKGPKNSGVKILPISDVMSVIFIAIASTMSEMIY